MCVPDQAYIKLLNFITIFLTVKFTNTVKNLYNVKKALKSRKIPNFGVLSIHHMKIFPYTSLRHLIINGLFFLLERHLSSR